MMPCYRTPMTQTELFVIVSKMKPGQRFQINGKQLVECANGSIKSILLDGPARDSDVREFIEKISQNWGVKVQQQQELDRAIIEKI